MRAINKLWQVSTSIKNKERRRKERKGKKRKRRKKETTKREEDRRQSKRRDTVAPPLSGGRGIPNEERGSPIREQEYIIILKKHSLPSFYLLLFSLFSLFSLLSLFFLFSLFSLFFCIIWGYQCEPSTDPCEGGVWEDKAPTQAYVSITFLCVAEAFANKEGGRLYEEGGLGGEGGGYPDAAAEYILFFKEKRRRERRERGEKDTSILY